MRHHDGKVYVVASFKYQEGLGRDRTSQWLHGELRARLNFMDATGLAIVCPTLLEWFVS